MWTETELGQADLGDERLNKRLKRLVYDLAAQPMSSVPQACGTIAASKAAYRFWSSPRVSAAAIRDSHSRQAAERMRELDTVLAVQDTTELDFTAHRAMRGRGPLSFSGYQGLRVHSVLAVSSHGVPLGVVHQHVWARDEEPVGVHRRKRKTADKESQRWLTGAMESSKAVLGSTRIIVVADREGDMYDLFAQERPAHAHLLIRAAYNRRVTQEPGHIWETIQAQPALGISTVLVGRRAGQAPVEVTLEVKCAQVSVRAPHRGDRRTSPPVPMYGLLVTQIDPPEGTPAIEWCLLTTLPIETWEQAQEVIRWYSYRWLIERYHFVLKSGCRIEELQLQSTDAIEKALATYSIVAWRLLWLLYEARRAPDTPASEVFAEWEWRALYATIYRTALPPPIVPTLGQAIRWIAQLGGFLARKGDGDPGVKTLWLGLRRLEDIAATWRLLQGSLPSSTTYG